MDTLTYTIESIDNYLDQFINMAICEDIGDGDHSSLACIPDTAMGRVQLLVKEAGVLAGVDVARRIFQTVDSDIAFDIKLQDGQLIRPGDVAFTVSGKVHTLLKCERLTLNVLQRMSGIATSTRHYVDRLEGLNTKILDTRKTTPGLRVLEKAAVRIGGAVNHRMGLFDMVMLKDNHIDFAGGIEQAIKKTLTYLTKINKALKVEIEVRDFDELNQVLAVGQIDRIMLDNFTPSETRQAVELIAGRYETESSGGITIDTIRDYAECGVDYISVGALTHNIKSLDLSLKAF